MKRGKKMLEDIKGALGRTLPVAPGYLSVGAAFGLMFRGTGLGGAWAVLMSVMMYAGSMQFVALDFFGGGYGLLEIAVITLLVNVRHVFYGLSFVKRFKGRAKPYMIFALTDETYSLLSLQKVGGREEFFTVLINQLYWIGGTAAGVAAGSFIKINTKGMEFAMTALFTVILTGQLKDKSLRPFALYGAVCALAALLIFGPGGMILPAMIMLVITLLALNGRRIKETGEGHDE